MPRGDYIPKKANAFNYDANKVDVNQNTDTVRGQMEGLLDSGSEYIRRAKQSGMEAANRRGLLNSSIAAGAAQGAAYDAALPIAQQDATTYATRATENQKAENEALKFNATTNTDVSKTNAAAENENNAAWRNLEQQQTINEQQNTAAEDLQTLQSEQKKEAMRLQGDLDINKLEKQGEIDLNQINRQGEIDSAAREEAFGYQTQVNTQQNDAQIALQELQGRQTIEQKELTIQAEKDLAKIKSDSDLELKQLNVDQADRDAFSQFLNESGQQYLIQTSKISLDGELTVPEKNAAKLALYENFKANAELTASLFGTEISWDSFPEPPTSDSSGNTEDTGNTGDTSTVTNSSDSTTTRKWTGFFGNYGNYYENDIGH